MAVHFANCIADKGIELASGEKVTPPIRFLGLWDVVASFGLSFDTLVDFQSINIGWNIDEVPKNVQNCFHAMALDERQETFNVTRLDNENSLPNVTEMWFRGNHSDVGGGNKNPKRSNISLEWMLQNAHRCHLPVREDDIDLIANDIDPKAPFILPTDAKRDERRKTNKKDLYHDTAVTRKLAVGESISIAIDAGHKWNWSGILLEKGATYRFDIGDVQKWMDGGVTFGPGGWESHELPWYKEDIVGLFESKRRCPEANWFELIGALGDEGDNLFRIGKGGDEKAYQAIEDAELYTFANDLDWKYDNNKGQLLVTKTRTQ